MKPPTISYLSNIYFEIDSVKLLPEILARYEISHPLVVTDRLDFTSRISDLRRII